MTDFYDVFPEIKATFGNRRNWSKFMEIHYAYARWFAGVRP